MTNLKGRHALISMLGMCVVTLTGCNLSLFNATDTGEDAGKHAAATLVSATRLLKAQTSQPPRVVQEVTRDLEGRTSLPVIGPTYVPMRPPTDPRPWNAVSAWVQLSATSYQVDLTYTDTALPVNSPALHDPQNTGLARILGGYGLQRCTSPQQAWATASRLDRMPPNTLKWPTSPVSLQPGLEGKVHMEPDLPSGSSGVVTWRQSGWQFMVCGGPLDSMVAFSKQLSVYVSHHPLPHSQGFVFVNDGGDGEHTTISWIVKNDVYNCSNYHSAQQALRMARSIQPMTGR